jgi:hypothetical protein
MEHDDAKREAGRQGGKARAVALTRERKKEIAQTAALARWGARATHRGNFKDEFGIDVDCYVLDDPNKTAVISLRGMAAALGLSESGTSLRRFVSGKVISQAVGVDLLKKLNKPLIFEGLPAGAGQPPMPEVHGHDVTLLIDVCKAIVEAEAQGKLLKSQANIAKQAHIILSASAKSGIKGLVYALSGYNPSADEVIQAFKIYVQEEAKKYEPEFPEALYQQWYRLYQIPVFPGRGWPWQFKHLTVRHVYYPLAKSNGKILELLRALKGQGGDQKKKLFQFLNDVGARALRIHIGRLLEMTETSDSQAEYENKIASRFGGQTELDLVVPVPAGAEPTAQEQT